MINRIGSIIILQRSKLSLRAVKWIIEEPKTEKDGDLSILFKNSFYMLQDSDLEKLRAF